MQKGIDEFVKVSGPEALDCSRLLAIKEGIVGRCFSTGQPILVDDVSKSSSYLPIASLPETSFKCGAFSLKNGIAPT